MMLRFLGDGENVNHVRAIFQDLMHLINKHEKHALMLLLGCHGFQRGDGIHSRGLQGRLVRICNMGQHHGCTPALPRGGSVGS